jgi:chromosome segregation ATPase
MSRQVVTRVVTHAPRARSFTHRSLTALPSPPLPALPQIEFAEAERTKALEEKEALRVAWRQQTEDWFHTAAAEMQGKLLADWGAADGLQSELALCKRERARADATHASQVETMGSSEQSLRSEVQALGAECEAVSAERDELRVKLDGVRAQLKAAQHSGQLLVAQAEVHSQQLSELKETEAQRRERIEADAAERLELRGQMERALRTAESLRVELSESQAREKLTARVSERVRAEASEEHSRLLEALAKLDALQEQYDLLSRQNNVLVRSAETAVGA